VALVLFAFVGLAPLPASHGSVLPQGVGGSGFHALDDAQHASDHLAFQAATTKILPRGVASSLPGSNPNLRREVFGFAPYWELSHYAEWDFNLLSTVAYFGLDVNADGTFATSGNGWNGWNSADLTAIINKAHAAGGRVVVVIKDFNDSSINYVVTTAAMQTLISQTIAAIASKNLDGVNVDFEGSGDPRFPDIQLGITNLMTAMSAQVHARWPQAEVSIDTYTGSASWDGGIFKIGDLAPVVDAMFVMAYDSVFSNMPGHAGPNAPMNGWTYNDTLTVQQYLTKAPASKIILGVPYHGYRWSTVDGSLYSAATSGGKAVTYWGAVADQACGPMALHTGWDPTGQSPWMAWWSPSSGDPCTDNLGSPQELYYDNAASLGIKYDLVNANNLRGTGMWALGYDSGQTDLWHELALKFATTPWTSLGGTLASGPDASSWSANRLDVFSRGTDNALWHASWNGTAWAPIASLDGVITSAPGAVSWGPNRIDLFARGQDNGLWHMSWNGYAWSGWQPLGGVFTSGPDVASWGAGRLDVFARGQDNGLWHMSWNGTSWSSWQSLGGVLTSDPTAVSWGPNRIDIFARGQDNGLWHLSWNGGSWSAWQSLGGVLTSGPDASSCAAGHLDVYATSAGSALYQLGWNGSGWSAWQTLGGGTGPWPSDPSAICAPGTGAAALFERGSDNALWQSSVAGS
jgi:hypothetical protein